MRRITLTLAMFIIVFLSASHFAEANCMMLGWSGGPGSKAQWTRANMQERGNTVTISYNWKNGIMRGTLQPDGSLEGNWIQDDSKGGLFMFRRLHDGKAEGWWTNAGQQQRYPMVIQTCER